MFLETEIQKEIFFFELERVQKTEAYVPIALYICFMSSVVFYHSHGINLNGSRESLRIH